jgi:hypothetical protein
MFYPHPSNEGGMFLQVTLSQKVQRYVLDFEDLRTIREIASDLLAQENKTA